MDFNTHSYCTKLGNVHLETKFYEDMVEACHEDVIHVLVRYHDNFHITLVTLSCNYGLTQRPQW